MFHCNTALLMVNFPFLVMLHRESAQSFCGSSKGNKQNSLFLNRGNKI